MQLKKPKHENLFFSAVFLLSLSHYVVIAPLLQIENI